MGSGAGKMSDDDVEFDVPLPVSPRNSKGNKKVSKTRTTLKKHGGKEDDFVNPFHVDDAGHGPTSPRRTEAARLHQAFALSTASPKTPVRCHLVRKNHSWSLYDRRGHLLATARATNPMALGGTLTGGWSIHGGGKLLGKVVATDLEGTLFKFVPHHDAPAAAVGAMKFSPNPVNRSLPPALKVVLPVVDTGGVDAKSLLRRLKDKASDASTAVADLSSAPIKWDGEGWVLNFPKDIPVRASAKNFQLLNHRGDVVLMFARTMADTFCVEYAAPLSEFTALCACLASIKSYRVFQ